MTAMATGISPATDSAGAIRPQARRQQSRQRELAALAIRFA